MTIEKVSEPNYPSIASKYYSFFFNAPPEDIKKNICSIETALNTLTTEILCGRKGVIFSEENAENLDIFFWELAKWDARIHGLKARIEQDQKEIEYQEDLTKINDHLDNLITQIINKVEKTPKSSLLIAQCAETNGFINSQFWDKLEPLRQQQTLEQELDPSSDDDYDYLSKQPKQESAPSGLKSLLEKFKNNL